MHRFLRWILGIQQIKEITISHSLVEDLCEIARASHPKEMLAFLSSTKGNRRGLLHIDELQLQAYDASNSSANVPLGNLPMTTRIVGTAHSHPGGSKRPSDADLHLFSKFGYVHAIIAEPYTPATIRFMDKEGSTLAVRIIQ
jgi:proteasome lid subunit RPN8/RPN11